MTATRRTPLATSRALRHWLRSDPAWHAQPLAWRAQQTWLAALGSLNQRLSAATQAQSVTIEIADPVFLIGPWRSGTTVMHELLVAATGCTTPRTWQCMDPCAFALPRRERKAAVVARPMDGIEIRGDSPQEDEFALLALGVESAYRAFWMPHRLVELHATLDPAHWLAHPEWLAPWETFLRGVLASAGGDALQPLILKSPNHSYRIASIMRRFPGARFVWMLRDPIQVFHSNCKMWAAMFATHGMTRAEPGTLEAFVAFALRAIAQVMRDALAGASSERWVFVSNEALIARPEAVVDAVADRLRLPLAPRREALIDALDRMRQARVDRYAQAVPAVAEAACAELAAVHRDVLALRHAIV